MRFTAIVAALAATATATPVLLPRDINSVTAAIAKIQSDTIALNNTITSFHGGFSGLLKAIEIKTKNGHVKDDTEDATNAINTSAKFNSDDSGKVAQQILKLVPIIQSTLGNLASKKQEFDYFLIGGLIKHLVNHDLKDLKVSTDEFSGALTKKLSGVFAGAAPQISKEIDNSFDKVIATYQ